MARRHWTLLVVPDDHSAVKQYHITSRGMRWLVTALVLVFAVLGGMSAGYLLVDHDKTKSARLERTNALLSDELAQLRGEVATLETALTELSAKDERYRLLANLEPLDEDVKLAGVGGPGSRTIEADPLWGVDRTLAARTFEATEELEGLIRRANLLSVSWEEATEALEEQVDIWERTPSILPADGYLSSGFSRSRLHPILNERRPHNGIDIVARHGTPVVAAAKGTVVYAGNTGGDYGYMIDIDHGHGVRTRYAHLARGSMTVRRGETVERWEKIGEVGSTGLVTSPSIHYEVLVDGRPQDPDRFVLGEVLRF
jgi:murein DD-endopeptidase MepM/ murein hydrolase activator NlpD